MAARKQAHTRHFDSSHHAITPEWPVTRQLPSITTAKQFARLIFADYLVSDVPKLTGKLREP
jgi:hypothetical protein